MGSGPSSSSSVSNTVTNNTVNNNFMSTLNKNILNSATNTVSNQKSSCSAAPTIGQNCSVSNFNTGGNFNFTGEQTSDVKVSLSCLIKNNIASKMEDAMASAMASQMKAMSGTKAASKLNAAATATATSGFMSPPSSTNTDVNNSVTNNVTNNTAQIVKNIFKKNISNNFTSNTLNKCSADTSDSQNQSLKNINVGGNANIKCDQNITLSQVSECKMLNSAINKSVSETLQKLGVKTEAKDITSSETEEKAEAKSVTVSTGPIQEIGTALTNIIGAIVGPVAAAAMAPYIASVSLCCCCCIIIIIVMLVMSSNSSSTATPPMEGGWVSDLYTSSLSPLI